MPNLKKILAFCTALCKQYVCEASNSPGVGNFCEQRFQDFALKILLHKQISSHLKQIRDY